MKKRMDLDIGSICAGLIFFVYFISVFVVNIKGRIWVNYDIYSDAILAKYMAEGFSIFPEGWCFGNQIYVVATPVVAAVLCLFIKDAYLSLAVASCIMTVLSIVCYIWCVKPFVKPKGIIISLLVLIGGTNIGISAHGDTNGLQVFYTMASYYACYVIGIFATLGVYFRLLCKMEVKPVLCITAIALNFALGMQSLRELLVLNIPLVMLAFLQIILPALWKSECPPSQKKSIQFSVVALAANICGVITTKLLILWGVIKQNTMIRSVNPTWWNNVQQSISSFLEYIGFVAPLNVFFKFRILGAIGSTIIVAIALGCVIFRYLKHKTLSIIGCGILFFWISLMAVFFAGILVLDLRPIYFFCWYSLVTFSTVYLIEMKWQKLTMLLSVLKRILILGLVCISIYNYRYTFGLSFRDTSATEKYYQGIIEQLREDGIEYLYSDWRTEKNVLASMSHDEIKYGTLAFSDNPDDLWNDIDWLYLDSWFDSANFGKAYIILSDVALDALENEFSAEYKSEFISNLELVHRFEGAGTVLYFYKGSPKMFSDMIQ